MFEIFSTSGLVLALAIGLVAFITAGLVVAAPMWIVGLVGDRFDN